MLAQNFKTPADLGITDAEFSALSKVLGMLERGEIKYSAGSRDVPGQRFNMSIVYHLGSCGSVGCIMGWAKTVGQDRDLFESTCSSDDQSTQQQRVNELFLFTDEPNISLMQSIGRTINSVTDAEAAIALRNFLTHGDPRWAEALA